MTVTSPGESLTLRRLQIDTYQDFVIYMHRDCPACRAEGFEAQARVEVHLNGTHIVATLHTVASPTLAPHEASLSESAWRELGAKEGDRIWIRHAPLLESLSALRAKVYGRALVPEQWRAIIHDIVAGHYSDLHLAAFVTSCAGDRISVDETIDLTRAMVAAGERLEWSTAQIVDKHCVGGLPGNRTTLIVVPIVAAAGLTIPKTSSRAITSPSGTADTMETLAPVTLSLEQMRRVVEREHGCIVWGGNARLSPADDLLIRVERPLDFDSDGQLVASVLSKKISAGATHALIDMPVGPTAKVRSLEAAAKLSQRLTTVGAALGVEVRVQITDGTQPVGRGIGPSLEARDALAVLQGEATAPQDLRARAVTLAGRILEFSASIPAGKGEALAEQILSSGRAWKKFQAICEAQGGMRNPPAAKLTSVVAAPDSGKCVSIDNRRIARVAKLAGAPRLQAAGVDLHVHVGETIEKGQPLFTVHGDAPGELSYALNYLGSQAPIVALEVSR